MLKRRRADGLWTVDGEGLKVGDDSRMMKGEGEGGWMKVGGWESEGRG